MSLHTPDTNLHTGNVSVSTYTAGLLQAQSYRALKSFMTAQLGKYELTMQEWALVGILRDHNKQRLSDIAMRMRVEASLSTTLANRLLKKQLIERLPDPTDKRAKLVALTPKGRRMVDTMEIQLRTEMKAFLHDISAAELVVYIGVMAKIAAKAGEAHE